MAPAEDQHITRPSVSVMVICVLLKDAAMLHVAVRYNAALALLLEFFLALRCRCRFPGAPVSGAVPAAFGSFATFHSDRALSLKPCRAGAQHAAPLQISPFCLRLLLCCDCAAARSLAGARVGVRALAAHRKIPAMANAAITPEFQSAGGYSSGSLCGDRFHPAFLLDGLANVIDFLFGQVANLLGVIHAGFRGQLFRALRPIP